MKFVGIISGIGLCVLLGTVMWFAPKLQDKADLWHFEKDVQEFGKIYLKYQRQNGRPPQSITELQPLVDTTAPSTRERVKNDEFTVAWGAKVDPDSPDARSKMLVVGKTVIHGQQVVIHQDGIVRHYSPAEVKKMILATAEESSPTK